MDGYKYGGRQRDPESWSSSYCWLRVSDRWAHTDWLNKGVCSGDQGSTGNIQLQFVRADALLRKFTAFTGYLPHYKWQAVWSENSAAYRVWRTKENWGTSSESLPSWLPSHTASNNRVPCKQTFFYWGLTAHEFCLSTTECHPPSHRLS